MTLTLIQHQWKAFWRSKNSGKSITIRVVMAVIILYLFANLVLISFFLDKLLTNVFPDLDLITAFASCLLYYFLLDILMRFQMQELPTLSVKPYLSLNIKRSQIINYLSLISLTSGFNFAPFVLTLPFLIKIILHQEGYAVFWGLLVAITGFTIFNHFFSLWFKRNVNLNPWWMLGFLGVIGLLIFLDFHLHVISFSAISLFIFKGIIAQPVWSLLVVLGGIIMYLINYYFLKSNLYLDDLHSASAANKSSTDIPFLNHFGKPGELAGIELKLIFRNKRPKSSIMMSFFFMFYGLFFYNNPSMSAGYVGSAIFCGMFMTGVFIINYGQFMFSWQSSHFDGLLSNKISVEDFFKSKFLLFTFFSTINLILTFPYVYFGWKIILIHFIMYFWNLGINTLLVLYFANRNYKRIDLSKSASFNWEGTGASQWILSIPLLISPLIIHYPLHFLGYPEVGLTIIGVTGIAFIITRQYWLNKLVKRFSEQRYTIAEGFRND
ncbi:MAG TPA: DUF5687 family protein [Daejeonella sp.]|nr:DUF5687 family protein [Daejeonella sp.]